MSDFLPFAVPQLDQDDIDEVVDTLTSGWITTGPKAQRFETLFAQAVGAKFAVAVNSCTAALHLALEAVGVGPGDEVITTPYTFAASAEVIRYMDAVPVFIDVLRQSLNIDPGEIEGAVTSRTKAILPVHIAGFPAAMDEINAIAARHGLRVIEDAAHAFPAARQGKRVGEGSDIACFSFYATKTITTAEGGMLCTNDEMVAERCRVMSLHGISKDAWKRYSKEGSWYYEVVAPGFKYNMPDIAAALGLSQLRKVEQMRRRRAEIADAYNAAFEGVPELETPHGQEDVTHSWHLYMLRLQLDRLTIDRAKFIDILSAKGIGTSVHFIPLHTQPYYVEEYAYEPRSFPVAYEEYLREVSLPIYPSMSDNDIDRVIAAVIRVAECHTA